MVLLLGAAPCAMACSQLPSGTSFWIRLSEPISSYNARAGMIVRGTLLESPVCDGEAVLPINIPVEGKVVSAHRVGLGLVHETAAMQIEFLSIIPSGVPPIEIHGQVDAVDNARENVKKGVIHGIRSTETPQGQISSRLKYLPSWRLYPDPFLLAFKLLFPIFPEPEINLAPGTDLRVELQDNVTLPASFVQPLPIPLPGKEEEQVVEATLDRLPSRTFDKKLHEADLINVLFVGSREQLEQGFAAAGWKQSEAVSRRTVMHQFHAFLAETNYSTAPMSRQSFDGHQPDLMLQKTFDSYEKREHLRIWHLEQTADGVPLWASAAVRETGATLSVKQKGFMHHVSEDLDEERSAILRDLGAAGCVESEALIDQPGSQHVVVNATGELLRADGNVMMLHLKTCDKRAGGNEQAKDFRPGSKFSRYLRKEILTVRSDLFRANAIYAAYELATVTEKSVRRSSAHRAEMRMFEAETHPAPDGQAPPPARSSTVTHAETGSAPASITLESSPEPISEVTSTSGWEVSSFSGDLRTGSGRTW